MKAYIKKLNEKPEHIRRQYLLGAMVVSILAIGSVWAYSLSSHLNESTMAKVANDIKPFALFGQSLKNTYTSITASAGTAGSSQAEGNTSSSEKLIPLSVQEPAN